MCALFVPVKAACRRSVLKIIVCQRVQTASTDVFVKNGGVEAAHGD